MESNKKIHIFIISILVFLGIMLELFYDNEILYFVMDFIEDFPRIPGDEQLISLSILFLIFITSFFISKLKFKQHNYYVYGISTTVILSSLLHANICQGKFCEIIDIWIISIITIFIIMYAIISYFRD